MAAVVLQFAFLASFSPSDSSATPVGVGKARSLCGRFSAPDADTGPVGDVAPPLSAHRPRYQFCDPAAATEQATGVVLEATKATGVVLEATLTVITATHNPSAAILDVEAFLWAQSLRSWRWIIVDDHTTNADSARRLRALANRPRTSVVTLSSAGGADRGSARNAGLDRVTSKYLVFLDDKSVMELTALEQAVWFLETHATVAMVDSYAVHTSQDGDALRTTGGFGQPNVRYSTMDGIVIRTSALGAAAYPTVGANDDSDDADVVLQLLRAGRVGYTVPEFLLWHQGYPSRRHDAAPATGRPPEGYAQFDAAVGRQAVEKATWRLPSAFANGRNRVAVPDQHSVLVVVSRMDLGSALELFLLDALAELVGRGCRVTVACTQLQSAHTSLPASLQQRLRSFTHDVFVLPNFLSDVDHPRFLSYIMQSRGVGVVWIHHCRLMYRLLPTLQPQHPRVRFVDMVHGLTPRRKQGGFAAYSAVTSRHLHLTHVTSQAVAHAITARGDPDTKRRLIHPHHVATVIDDLEAQLRLFQHAERRGLSPFTPCHEPDAHLIFAVQAARRDCSNVTQQHK